MSTPTKTRKPRAAGDEAETAPQATATPEQAGAAPGQVAADITWQPRGLWAALVEHHPLQLGWSAQGEAEVTLRFRSSPDARRLLSVPAAGDELASRIRSAVLDALATTPEWARFAPLRDTYRAARQAMEAAEDHLRDLLARQAQLRDTSPPPADLGRLLVAVGADIDHARRECERTAGEAHALRDVFDGSLAAVLELVPPLLHDAMQAEWDARTALLDERLQRFCSEHAAELTELAAARQRRNARPYVTADEIAALIGDGLAPASEGE